MKRIVKSLITYIISFIISYLIVGYILPNMFVKVHWVPMTAWERFRMYYIKNLPAVIMPALALAIIPAMIVDSIIKKDNK